MGFAASTLLSDLPRIIRRLRRRFPKIDLQLRELSTAQQLEALYSGDIELGFMREPLPHAELVVQEVQCPLLYHVFGDETGGHLEQRVPFVVPAENEGCGTCWSNRGRWCGRIPIPSCSGTGRRARADAHPSMRPASVPISTGP